MTINKIYAIHDNDNNLKARGAFPITEEEAYKYNLGQYGIFWTPNDFKGARKKENLVKINYWLADIDTDDKNTAYRKIISLIHKPTKIVETKRGFHCYWQAIDATIENYEQIEKGIIERLDADKGCKDVTRLLRYPEYNHWKDKENPYFVFEVYDFGHKPEYQYTEKQMLAAFSVMENKYEYRPYNIPKREYDRDKANLLDPNNWNRIFKLNTITVGNRNNELARIALWLKDEGFDPMTIRDVIFGINDRLSERLQEKEVESILRGKV